MTGKIFINYRREDSRDMAARTRDRLANAFGDDTVFMDVDNLRPGQRFDRELETALGRTDIFLAFIGPRWADLLQARQTSGDRDYVREELSGALKRGVVVIPVTVESAALPRSDSLPEDIRELVMHHKHSVTHENFGRDVAALVDAINFARTSSGNGGAVSPPKRKGRGAAIAAGIAALTLAGAGAGAWYWRSLTTSAPESTHTAAVLDRLPLERLTLLAADTNLRVAETERARLATEQARLRAEAKREVDLRDAAAAEARAKAEADERQRLLVAAAEAKRAADEAEAKKLAAAVVPAPKAEEPRVQDLPGRAIEAAPTGVELTRRLQSELKRVGCDPGDIDGKWGDKGTDALRRFMQHGRVDLVVSVPTPEALELLAKRTGRVCPLECDSDQRMVNGRCIDKPESEEKTTRAKKRDEDDEPPSRRKKREEPDDPPPRKTVRQEPPQRASSGNSNAPRAAAGNDRNDVPSSCGYSLYFQNHPMCQKKK